MSSSEWFEFRTLPYIAMSGVVMGNVIGNVLIKLGSSVAPEKTVVLGMFGWQTALGIGFFAASVLLYAWALKYLPLHLAQSIATLQFAGAVIAASLLLGETVTLAKWLGIGLICLGLGIVIR